MKDPIILRRIDTLTPSEASYWKDLFYRVIKIGTELEFAPPKGVKRTIFEENVREALQPSEEFARLGQNGVLDVKTEHCGIEVRVIGRHPHFRALHQQYQSIIGVLKAEGGRPRATCGLHFHLLTPTLAEPVPEIILTNIWNLTRRYAPELKLLTSAGQKRHALCRRRNHNSHLEMVRHSPATLTMAEIQQILTDSKTVPVHQNFLNLEHIRFTEEGAILPFHLEFRFPDINLSPLTLTAQTFLFMALAIKAVDLSQYGVIHVGKILPWRRKIELMNLLSNNDGNLATSDTSQVTDEHLQELQQGQYELLDFLAPTFDRLGGDENPALDILLALAEQPLSLRRCAGYSWDEIETQLSERVELDEVGLDKTDHSLMKHIELGQWATLPSTEAWHWHAARELYLTPQDLERRLARLERLRGLRWDDRRGTLVFVR